MQTTALLMSGVMLASLPLSLPSGGKDFTRERSSIKTVQTVSPNASENVTLVGDNAFGEIKLNTVPATESQARGQGGGGGGNSAVSENTDAQSSDMKILPVPYEQIRYEFVYEGELDLPEATELPVYKRVTDSNSGKGLGGLIKNLNLGLINPNQLDGLDVQQISLSDDNEFGYIIALDFVSEMVSIYQNYLRWPNPLNDCWKPSVKPEDSEACVQRNALRLEDIPEDAELIATARDFLRDYGISTTEYGEPYVNHDWRRYYEETVKQQENVSDADRAMYAPWVPEQLQVVFPRSHDGEFVYDSAGNPTGLIVSVDIRHDKAAGLFNLTTQNFEASNYPVESDVAKLRDIIKAGGVYPIWHDPNAEKVVKIPLEAPKRGFIQHYQYDAMTQSELAVPALIFAVDHDAVEDVNYFYPQQVIVPLVKDAIDMQQYLPFMMERGVESAEDVPEADSTEESVVPTPVPAERSPKASVSPKASIKPKG